MCGICGIYHFDGRPVQEDQLRAMMGQLRHRGPNDEGLFIEDNVGIGHVRLSILDLSDAGHQPMHSLSERFSIVFNGEIYNYIELTDELRINELRSGTDTEVLLNLFEQQADQSLDRLNGMFAFAALDREERTLTIVRDRFGIKPVYYYRDESSFYFASEIPALLCVLPHARRQDDQTIFDYLTFNRTDHTERTFFKDIKSLRHGHLIKLSPDRRPQIKRWYDVRENLGPPLCDPAEFYDLFRSSISLRLRSDVPVGVCLSGGLDSSAIVSMLVHQFDRSDVNSFSAVYGPGELGDESEFIREFDSRLTNMFYTRPNSESLLEDVEDFVSTHAEPVPSTSPYAQYRVMQLASEHVTVTLDGQGADEQLAGYHYFFGMFFKDLLRNLRLVHLAKEMSGYAKHHRSLFGFATLGYFMLPPALQTLVSGTRNWSIDTGFFQQYRKHTTVPNQIYGGDSLQEMMLSHFESKLQHLLKWADRNSMRWSVESRVPFLDHRLVERTLASSSDKMISRGTSKHILREAMRGVLPDRIRKRQDKVGFSTPESKWFRSQRYVAWFEEILNSATFRQRGYINPDVALRRCRQHRDGKINASREIWKWVNLELWLRAFVDGGPAVPTLAAATTSSVKTQ